MTWPEYINKHPLTRKVYSSDSVEKIRKHAFEAGHPAKKMTRSQKQNAYYWGVVLKIMGDETGYTADEMHQLMGRELLRYEHRGEMFIKSTTKLNTKEFEIYLEQVRRFASTELSVFVPLPRETEFAYEVKNEN